MAVCRYCFSWVCTLTLVLLLKAQECREIFFQKNRAEQVQACKALFSSPARSIRLQVQADVPHMENEVVRLLSVAPDGYVTEESFLSGMALLAKQQRFESIKIIQQEDSNGPYYLLRVASSWMVERVIISSTLIGKDRMRQAYLLNAGERFDHQKHEAGLDSIRALLRDEGYMSGVVQASYQDDLLNKLRIIQLHIGQGNQFVIKQIHIAMQASEQMSAHELGRVQRRIRKLAQQRLLGTPYQIQALNHATTEIHSEMLDRGFFHSQIKLQKIIDYEKEELKLHFTIESGTQHGFEFYGNHFFSRKRLLEEIIPFGSSATIVPSSLLAEELQSLYKKHGFLEVTITWSEEELRTFFFIQEGERMMIQAVDLRGVTAFSSQALVQAYFGSLVHAPFFQEEQIRQAIEAVTQHYLEAGFWDVVLLGYEMNSHEQGGTCLKISLQEGERRWLRCVELDDSWTQVPQELQPYLTQKHPIPFDVRLIQKQRQLLLASLRKQGRLYATPIPELITDTADVFVLRWKKSGFSEAVRIGSTLLCGTGRVPADCILRECTYQKGEIWDNQKLSATASRLKNLGIFETVSVVPDDITIPESSKNVIITCVPDEPYELRARIGAQGVNRNIIKWNGGASPKVGVSLIAKNPTNTCDRARLDFDYTRYMHDLVIRYRMPWLATMRLDAELQLYSSRYDQPVYLGSPEVLYRASRDGFLMTIHRPFDRWTMALASGVVWEQLETSSCGCAFFSEEHSVARARAISLSIDASPLLFAKKYAHFCFEATFMRNHAAARPWDDSLGPLTVFSLRGVMPAGLKNGSFVKLLFEQSYFYSLPFSLICGFKIRAGALLGAEFDRVMPIERFYLGGAYSLRSYEADYAPPLRTFAACSGRHCFVPTGGNVMLNSMAELRFPLYGRLSGICFADLGALSAQGVWAMVKPHHIMGALGAGLRVHTPVGAIRFDIGFKLQSDVTVEGTPLCNHRYAWFLTLGQAF